MPMNDRPPPHNIEAEEGVLGAILWQGDYLDAVVAILPTPAPFYRATHQVVWGAILALYRDGKPVDGTTVGAELERTGEIKRVGGYEALGEFISRVPHAENAAYYAEIVREKWRARELIESLNAVLSQTYANTHTADELINSAQGKVFDLAEGNSRSQLHSVHALLPDVIDAIQRRKDTHEVTGVGSGWAELDELAGGFQPGHLIVVAARPSMGKAQPMDAMVLTPRGSCPMGQIKVGDSVIGGDGKAVGVVAIHPQGRIPVYRVTTSDGGVTECCGDHLWFTQTRYERRRGCLGSVKSTKEIMATITRPGIQTSPDHVIPVVGQVRYAEQLEPLPLPPYAMGLLLGDGEFPEGNVRFTNPEPDIQSRLREALPPEDCLSDSGDGLHFRVKRLVKNNQISATKRIVRDCRLEGKDSCTKFIPHEYLHASPDDRLALLRGLMDTDGYVTSGGQSVEYSTSSPELAHDVASLARSLGGIVSTKVRVPTYSCKGETLVGAESFRMVLCFPNGLTPVSSAKHLAKWRFRKSRYHRTIVSVEPIGDKECQCITVDAEDGLYVADDFIVTHNSAFALNIADYVAFELKAMVMFASLEMDKTAIVERLIGSRGRIDSWKIRTGNGIDYPEIAAMGKARHAMNFPNLWIDDSSSQSVIQIMASSRSIARRGPLGAVIVDYIQLMEPENPRESRQEQVAKISRRLKQLARELKVPVIALSQLNRKVEDRDDHRPRMSDLRESGGIEQDADIVMLLHRADYYDPDKEFHPVVESEVIVAKNRNGATGTVKLGMNLPCMRFDPFDPHSVPPPRDDRF